MISLRLGDQPALPQQHVHAHTSSPPQQDTHTPTRTCAPAHCPCTPAATGGEEPCGCGGAIQCLAASLAGAKPPSTQSLQEQLARHPSSQHAGMEVLHMCTCMAATSGRLTIRTIATGTGGRSTASRDCVPCCWGPLLGGPPPPSPAAPPCLPRWPQSPAAPSPPLPPSPIQSAPPPSLPSPPPSGSSPPAQPSVPPPCCSSCPP